MQHAWSIPTSRSPSVCFVVCTHRFQCAWRVRVDLPIRRVSPCMFCVVYMRKVQVMAFVIAVVMRMMLVMQALRHGRLASVTERVLGMLRAWWFRSDLSVVRIACRKGCGVACVLCSNAVCWHCLLYTSDAADEED